MMNPVALHAGVGDVSLPAYLSRVLLFLLIIAVVAIAARWCLDIVGWGASTTATATEPESREDEGD